MKGHATCFSRAALAVTLLLFLSPLFGQSPDFEEPVVGRQFLVIIGINAYEEWTPLWGPVRDAEELRDVLIERYHIDEVLELYDAEATRADILELFQDLVEELKSDDSLIIYYAGHGHYDETSDSGFWIPSDGGSDLNEQRNWIANNQIRGFVRNMKARHILLIADACFAGDFLDISRGAQKELEIDDEYFKRAYKRIARQVLTSGSLETVPDNSSFALQLRRELESNKSSLLDPLAIFNGVRSGVTGTLPLFGSLKDTGHQQGSSFLLFLDEDPDAVAARKAKIREKQYARLLDKRIEAGLSFTLPGLGRLYEGRTIQGSLFVATSLLLAADYANARNRFEKAQSAYNRDLLPYILMQSAYTAPYNWVYQQDKYEELRTLQNRANRSAQLFALLWGWNVYDQMVTRRKARVFGITGDLRVAPTSDGIQVALETRF